PSGGRSVGACRHASAGGGHGFAQSSLQCPHPPPPPEGGGGGKGREQGTYLFIRLSTRSFTTFGSASVEVSPRLLNSFSAILRRMRRMILPERVLGRPGAHWMRSGEAMGPISFRTHCTNSLRSSSVEASPA